MAGLVEQDVRRLHVPMHEPSRVRGVERRRDLPADGGDARRLERALCAQERAEVGPVDEPHREVNAAVDVTGVVDRDDVRMLERNDELGLTGKALAEPLVTCERRCDELQSDGPPEPHVIGAVDDPHPTPADQLLDPKTEEVRADVHGRVHVHSRRRSKPTPGTRESRNPR